MDYLRITFMVKTSSQRRYQEDLIEHERNWWDELQSTT